MLERVVGVLALLLGGLVLLDRAVEVDGAVVAAALLLAFGVAGLARAVVSLRRGRPGPG